jgi:hypothetical protein
VGAVEEEGWRDGGMEGWREGKREGERERQIDQPFHETVPPGTVATADDVCMYVIPYVHDIYIIRTVPPDIIRTYDTSLPLQ